MKSHVLTGVESLEMADNPKPEPGPSEVVVEVDACGVCMTDYHMYHGTFPVETPVTLGHESAGTVESVGRDVDRIETGQQVALYPGVPCGQCRGCRAGNHNQCSNLIGIGAAADTVIDGSFAEYVVVPKETVVPAPGLKSAVAALTEPLACCVHAVDRTSLETGDTVVIIGAGPIGLLLTQTFADAGASEIVVSEPMDQRRHMAIECGADTVVDPSSEDPVESIVSQTNTVDIAVEVVGATETITQARSVTSENGETLIFGVPPQGARVEVSPFEIYYNEMDILGTFGSTLGTTQRAVTLLQNDRIDASRLVTEEYNLSQLPQAFDQMERRDGLKKIITP